MAEGWSQWGLRASFSISFSGARRKSGLSSPTLAASDLGDPKVLRSDKSVPNVTLSTWTGRDVWSLLR